MPYIVQSFTPNIVQIDSAIRESDNVPLVIVEGFLDCMMLWQNGIRRVVALMGSSLSTPQEELVLAHSSLATRIIVMLVSLRMGFHHLRLAIFRISMSAKRSAEWSAATLTLLCPFRFLRRPSMMLQSGNQSSRLPALPMPCRAPRSKRSCFGNSERRKHQNQCYVLRRVT